MKTQILIVDDEPNIRLTYRAVLEAEGYAVYESENAAQALEESARRVFHLAILDLRMPEQSGLDLLAELRERRIYTPVVIVTAYGDLPDVVRAMRLGAIDFLRKPLTPEELRNVTSSILVRHAPEPPSPKPAVDDFETHLSAAKRDLNLQVFGPAWVHLSRALELEPHSPEALNLAGVYFEMQEDYERARKLYGKAIKYGHNFEPAQQNMRRLFELFNFGSSKEPFALGEK